MLVYSSAERLSIEHVTFFLFSRQVNAYTAPVETILFRKCFL